MTVRKAKDRRPLPRTVDLLGFVFHHVTEMECVRHVVNESQSGRGGRVITPNIDILRLLVKSRELRECVRTADLTVADGMPIVWASRILGVALPERVAGSSLISTLSQGAADAGLSVYLLGGDPGTADAAACELQRRHPAIRIAGTCCPPRGFETDLTLTGLIVEGVKLARPDIVFVALGCPKQERLIDVLRAQVPKTWCVGVGISFSYLTGAIRRAPRWMRRSGLEWVFRLVQEPRRLTRRYLREDIPFALRFLALSTWARIVRLFPFLGRQPRLIP